MILGCPRCGARYRFDESKMPGESAVLRCRKCGAEIPVRRPASAGGKPVAGKKTALLADEPREFRNFMRDLLQSEGYEVSVTDSGEEALLLAGSHPFDLIFLNAYLRGIPGIHVCERIKSDPALKETKVLLVGALLGAADSGAPRKRYGADDFLSTSASREELTERIGRLAGEDAAPAASAAGRRDPESSRSAATLAPEESEIRRLARIMISDIEIYHPEKFSRALRDGTFFESFSEELGSGKEMIDRRFGHLSNRMQILSAALRDSLESYRRGGSRHRAFSA
jgi:predicted Zn finger-like uncharacterized protein